MINYLSLFNFKKHESLKIESCSFFNLVLGVNSVGKTSILDSISLFNKSNKNNSNPKNLIHNGQTFSSIFIKKNQSYELKIENNKKKYFINEKLTSISNISNQFQLSYSSSILQYDFLTIQGKRTKIEHLFQSLNENYLDLKNQYINLSTKRLCLLEKNDTKMLNIVEENMAFLGTKIQMIRNDIKILPFLEYEFYYYDKNFFQEMTQSERVEFIKKNLSDNRKIDILIKKNKFNPLSFEFNILYCKKPYENLSNSEQKKSIITLDLEIIKMIYQINQKKTILLIDEIDSFFSTESFYDFIEQNLLRNENILQIFATTPNNIEISNAKKIILS